MVDDATHAQVSSRSASHRATGLEEANRQMLSDGAVIVARESSSVVVEGDGQIFTEAGALSTVGGAETQGWTDSHDEPQERCFACGENHRLLHCEAKWNLVPPPRLFWKATRHPFSHIVSSVEINIPAFQGNPMLRVWFRVFGVHGIGNSWGVLFEVAAPVGLLVDVDTATLDGSRSNYIRMLIDLTSTDGAPFSSCINYGSFFVDARFELEESN